MAYLTSQDTYEQLRQQLHKTGLHRVVSYFETNWHLIHHEWANSFVTTTTFGNRKNNRLESINQKIVCSSFANLGDFFRELRRIIACLRVERDNVALNCMSKVSVHTIGDAVSVQISRHLLPYPAGLVCTELHKTDAVCMEDGQVSGEMTTCSVCSCSFNKRMQLPCCLIFAMHRHHGLNVYEETLSHTRWHIVHYQENEIKCKKKANCTVHDYLDWMGTETRDDVIKFATTRGRKQRDAKRAQQVDVRAKLSQRITANKQDTKHLEKKLKTTTRLKTFEKNTAWVTQQADLACILQGDIVGRRICHEWSETEGRRQVVYNGKVDKFNGKSGVYVVAYWSHDETFADAEDHNMRMYELAVDMIFNDLLFCSSVVHVL